MRKISLIIAIVLSLNVLGQVKDYVFTPENEPFKGMKYCEVLGGDLSSIYLHKINHKGRGETHFVQKVDRNGLKYDEPKQVVIEEDGYNIWLNRLLVFKDKLVTFVKKENKKSGKKILSVIIFDYNTMNKLNEILLTTPDEEGKDFVYGGVIKNNDMKTITVICLNSSSPFKNWKAELISVDLLSQTKRISNTCFLGDIESYNYKLDEKNNLYFAFLTKTVNNTIEKPNVNVGYFCWNVGNNTINLSNQLDNFSGYFIDMQITPMDNQKILITARYVKDSRENKYDNDKTGMINYVIDNFNSKVTSRKEMSFNKLLPSGDFDYNPKKNAMNYAIDKTYSYGNYSILIGHKDYVTSGSMSNGQDVSYAWLYDFFIEKINDRGEIVYHKNLPFASRLPIAPAPNHVMKQFVDYMKGNKLYIFHNETPATTKILESGTKDVALGCVWDGAKHFVANEFNVDDGTVSRKVIEIQEKNKFDPIPERFYHLAHSKDTEIFDVYDNTIYVPISWGDKMERFLKVTLD